MNLRRVNAACGMFSAEIFVALWIAAAFFAPDWKIGELSLSDLGICGVAGGEICFNMGCACGGLFGVMFGIYVASHEKLQRYLGVLIIVACFGLAGIGIVNLGYGSLHFITATVYALFSIVCILLSIVIDYRNGDLDFAILSSVLLLFCLIAQITQPFVVYEPIDVACECIWIAAQSIKYMRREDSLFASTPAPA
jgi:hypothetical membrane protein